MRVKMIGVRYVSNFKTRRDGGITVKEKTEWLKTP